VRERARHADQAEEAVELMLQQVEILGEAWV